MSSDWFLYKSHTKQICHITASKVNYHMTQISTNNKCLKLGISSKFDQLQNISLIQASRHYNLSLKIFANIQPCPWHIFPTSHWLPNCRGPFFSSLIGHQDTWLIITSHCSLSFQEFITLHAFATSRSLVVPIKSCLILLKFIFQYIATLYLFYHCTSMFISYAFYIKTWPT